MALKLMYITNDPKVASVVQNCGVDRIFVDLEILGKQERQGHIDSVKSHHTVEDVRKLRAVIKESELLVRVNPVNAGSKKEIDAVIEAGADIIMLPMWKRVEDVAHFLHCVDKRVKTMLLLETKEAAECLDEVLALGGFDEIHIGLNDLHLSYGLSFMFELLSNGMVETLCQKIKQYNIPYGFGGIARLNSGLLPAEKVIMEHYRLGSTRAILSRSFCDVSLNLNYKELFEKEMKLLRAYEQSLEQLPAKEFEKNRLDVAAAVREIIAKKSC